MKTNEIHRFPCADDGVVVQDPFCPKCRAGRNSVSVLRTRMGDEISCKICGFFVERFRKDPVEPRPVIPHKVGQDGRDQYHRVIRRDDGMCAEGCGRKARGTMGAFCHSCGREKKAAAARSRFVKKGGTDEA